jgi:hypothetical protein
VDNKIETLSGIALFAGVAHSEALLAATGGHRK